MDIPANNKPLARIKATVRGIVQGVGFRPFIYNLAGRHNLSGYVANTGSGVDIEVEGERGAVEAFIRAIRAEKPPLAEITHLETEAIPSLQEGDFVIRPSRAGAGQAALISPDIGLCDDCLREMTDPEDRRYRYPFVNCTNCGPRYTITRGIPYDRELTSMAPFRMCEPCQREYDNPRDRRFHAQPNACWTCGPQVRLLDGSGRPGPGESDPVDGARRLLGSGKIVAVKGLGGFHLAVDGTDDGAVRRLRARKYREEKPFALMAPTLEAIETFARVSPREARELRSVRRPIVLLEKKDGGGIAEAVAPGNRYIGVMLPYTPIHHLLLEGDSPPLVMTSGNTSDEPIAYDNDEAVSRLSGIADAFLVHDREIVERNDDTVLRVAGGRTRLIRRSRGYAPAPIVLDGPMRSILACGPALKSTVCLTREENAFLSQHVGDLDNLETCDAFEATVAHLESILEIEPEGIAHDLHPDYFSTRYALGREGPPRVGVQHHHAHVASCMAENGLRGPVIGLAMDGTGYGTDGTIWGGEVLVADRKGFERVGHLETVRLPGGEAAVKAPWRMALAYLHLAFGRDLFDLPVPFVKRLDPRKAPLLLTMIDRGVNAPVTSSCGRLFDGVAALIGLRDRVSYEGQAAVELEMAMGEGDRMYPVEISEGGAGDLSMILRVTPIIRAIVSDLTSGIDAGTISRTFHNTLTRLLTEATLRVREETGLTRVVLSGGVFQNVFLLTRTEEALRDQGLEVHTHSRVPTNDGGVSLGQAVVADAILSGRDASGA